MLKKRRKRKKGKGEKKKMNDTQAVTIITLVCIAVGFVLGYFFAWAVVY